MSNLSCRTSFGQPWTLPGWTWRRSVLRSHPHQTLPLNLTSPLSRLHIICLRINFLSHQSWNLSYDKVLWNSVSAGTDSLFGEMLVWKTFPVDHPLIKRSFIFWRRLSQKGAITDREFGIFGHLRIWSAGIQQSRTTFHQLYQWKTPPNLPPQNLQTIKINLPARRLDWPVSRNIVFRQPQNHLTHRLRLLEYLQPPRWMVFRCFSRWVFVYYKTQIQPQKTRILSTLQF